MGETKDKRSFDEPTPMSAADAAWATSRTLAKLMPEYQDIPDEFRRGQTVWNKHQSEWFFKGLATHHWVAKPGIDRVAAFGHLSAIQQSWDPPHEHKSAAVAYLMSLWFEEPKADAGPPPMAEKPKRPKSRIAATTTKTEVKRDHKGRPLQLKGGMD